VSWEPLPRAGCRNVEFKVLLREPHLALAMLRFGMDATIDEHSAEFDINVVCVQGRGFASVGGRTTQLEAGGHVHWPAGAQHCLWTEDTVMQTLMVEHRAPADADQGQQLQAGD
jgi:quercetin dioxygenase-like cupin family protein